MQRMRSGAMTLAVGAVILTVTGCTATDRTTSEPLPPAPADGQFIEGPSAAGNVVLGDGRDRTASRTAADWATYADHVLVVTATGETRIEPSKREVERGEGMIGRTVHLTVNRVLWSAPDAPQKAPTTLTLSAAGWVFNNNEGRSGDIEFAVSDSSRLEKGHSYIKAVEWVDDPCSTDPTAGSWEGLGSGDTIPYDGGVLGAGEFEGRTQTLSEAKATVSAGESDLRRTTAGASVDALVNKLKSAKANAEKNNRPRECNPSDQ